MKTSYLALEVQGHCFRKVFFKFNDKIGAPGRLKTALSVPVLTHIGICTAYRLIADYQFRFFSMIWCKTHEKPWREVGGGFNPRAFTTANRWLDLRKKVQSVFYTR